MAAGGAAAAGLWWTLPAAWAAERGRGRVVLIRDDALWPDQADPDVAAIKKALDEAVRRLTGRRTPLEAWKQLFRAEDRVLVKLNCLAGRELSTRPEVAQAVAQGIHEAGVPWSQIVLWERRAAELQEAGYQPQTGAGQVQVMATDQLQKGMGGYESQPEYAGQVATCFSLLLTRYATAVVNVPILKDHNLAGLSGGMKNFYGAIHNPNKYHDNHCDPYVADLSASPHIRDKLRLVVCDALKAQCENGPAFSPAHAWRHKGLLVGLDPVALDAVAVTLIDAQRRRLGLKGLAEAGRPPLWIQTAAAAGLGEADLGRIECIHL